MNYDNKIPIPNPDEFFRINKEIYLHIPLYLDNEMAQTQSQPHGRQ